MGLHLQGAFCPPGYGARPFPGYVHAATPKALRLCASLGVPLLLGLRVVRAGGAQSLAQRQDVRRAMLQEPGAGGCVPRAVIPGSHVASCMWGQPPRPGEWSR